MMIIFFLHVENEVQDISYHDRCNLERYKKSSTKLGSNILVEGDDNGENSQVCPLHMVDLHGHKFH